MHAWKHALHVCMVYTHEYIHMTDDVYIEMYTGKISVLDTGFQTGISLLMVLQLLTNVTYGAKLFPWTFKIVCQSNPSTPVMQRSFDLPASIINLALSS